MTIFDKLALCYNCAIDKKATDVVMFDVRGVSDITDTLLIASGASARQVSTIVNAIEEALRAAGEKQYHIEGRENAWWVLIDAGEVVAHIFQEEARRYYSLERHWGDTPQVAPETLPAAPAPAAK